MTEPDQSTPDLSTELRLLRQAIGDLAGIMAAKMDLRGPAVLDMKEAATYLGTTRGFLYDLVKHGGIPFRKIGRKIIFLKADLNTWLDALPGLSVKQAIASMKPEHRELYLKGSVRMRYEEPVAPEEPITSLVRGTKGHNRERLAKG